MVYRIAITPGEPAGIGPDICIKVAQQQPGQIQLVVIADPAMLQERANLLGLPIILREFDPAIPAQPSPARTLDVIAVPLATPARAGHLNPVNSPYVLSTLRIACDRILRGELDALVTGPVNKGAINDAGIEFSGHTEFLAEYCHQELTVMMLATPGLRVALATTHLPLSAVPSAITRDSLSLVIDILHRDLQEKFGIEHPQILVCGLNPHAGEGGHLGREEIEIIEPVLQAKRAKGMHLAGPLPADTLFTDKYLQNADAVLSMYHDQGLPVLKFKGFGNASNITLGLPLVRTSVDHGTALDLAGTGSASTGSLYNAIATATEMVRHWQAR